jgi:regulator of cell morphogenesis and NO signaling
MKQTTVRELVSEDFRTASVFEKHAIDFCCHGNVTLEEACRNSGVSTEQVQQELEHLKSTEKGNRDDYSSWDLDFLAEYIVRTHHRYVKETIPMLTTHLEKVVHKHGSLHPEVQNIQRWFQEIAEELTRHMAKEELILFPYITRLVKAHQNDQNIEQPLFGSIVNPIRMMESDHEKAGHTMESIRTASKDFTAPADACTTFRVTYEELHSFDADLHKHVHLENNILFPKVIELERQMMSSHPIAS